MSQALFQVFYIYNSPYLSKSYEVDHITVIFF